MLTLALSCQGNIFLALITDFKIEERGERAKQKLLLSAEFARYINEPRKLSTRGCCRNYFKYLGMAILTEF